MAELIIVKLECRMVSAGKTLLDLSSVASTTTQELLISLDKVEGLLSEVQQTLYLLRQTPSWSMKDALHPSMKALVSDQLLKHSDIDVKFSVAACISELTRIISPDVPYDGVQKKDIFQLTVMALGTLSTIDPRFYYKARRVLDNMTYVTRACVDFECDKLIAEMFKLFLDAIRCPHSNDVFQKMESIMTRTLQESKEITDELLSILLDSIDRREEIVSSRTWMLGEKVMTNCTVRLKNVLPKMVRSRNLNVDYYSSIVATICSNSSEDKHTCGS